MWLIGISETLFVLNWEGMGMFKKLLKIGMMPLLWVVLAPLAFAEELCAEVRIEILQELTMERQGFEALMRINNSLDSFEIRDVSVTVSFEDDNGNPVVATSDTSASDAAFFIRLDASQNMSGLETGANGRVDHGVIAPNQTGELRWLIIPTANAAGQLQDGKLYYVGAQLSYSYGGKEENVSVAPDSIVVKPQPALTLDYFLTQEIIGNDAFTSEIEPPEPYTLGVRLSNNGYGVAQSVNIESAQPTIVENDLGLAVDFTILGSYLAGEPAEPSLLINFGDIQPDGVKSGRWIMETSLSGQFTAFSASFTHADELGGELTSLLEATNAHFLKRDVLVDLPGRDNVRDFLAYGPTGGLYVYESENTGLNETLCTNCAAVTELPASLNNQGETGTLTHDAETGFSYAQVDDPYQGTKVLERVVRSDDKVMNPQNAWLSKERADDNVNFDHYVNVFDAGSTGEYTLYWGEERVDVPQAPVIRHIPPQVTYEGGSLGFLVLSSDPNGTTPTVSAGALPNGAEFTDQGNGNGVFQWSPQQGQAGVYSVNFISSDGAMSAERSVHVQVNPWYDTDGDGMDDAWEMEHFGTLDRDGTGDYSGDGRTDLQAFEEGLDPTVAVTIPGVPQIASPIFDEEILQGEPEPYYPQLAVTNSNHSHGIESVEVIFEVYSDDGMTNKVASAVVDEGQEKTSLQIDQSHMVDDAVFENNSLYFWRARARDKIETERTSGWVKSRFYINAELVPPTNPQISSPSNDSIVDNVSPRLTVTNSSIEGRGRLFYGFSLFDESDLSTPLAETSGIAPGIDGETAWRVPIALEENTGYLWRVTVESDTGLSAESEWGFFIVSTENSAPSSPIALQPQQNAQLEAADVVDGLTLTVANGVDPERMPLTYYFELDVVDTFDSEHKRISPSVSEGDEQTSWDLADIEPGQTYYWRARASDGELYSDWVRAQFRVKSEPVPPPVPVLQNPIDGALVETLKPVLEVNPVEHPDLEAIVYRFELYSEDDLNEVLTDKETPNLQWSLQEELVDGETYRWRVRAQYGELHGDWSELHQFEVSDPNVTQPPEFSFVLPDAELEVDPSETDSVLIQWVDHLPNGAASIDLSYRDETGQLFQIATGIDAADDGEGDQYHWDVSQLPAGRYRLIGEITDQTQSVSEESCCDVVILESQCPTPVGEWVDILDDVDLHTTNPRRSRRSQDATTEMHFDSLSDEPITGPVRLILTDLTDPVYLANADGAVGDDSYIYLLEEGVTLEAGESSGTRTLYFADAGQILFNFGPVLELYQESDDCN